MTKKKTRKYNREMQAAYDSRPEPIHEGNAGNERIVIKKKDTFNAPFSVLSNIAIYNKGV